MCIEEQFHLTSEEIMAKSLGEQCSLMKASVLFYKDQAEADTRREGAFSLAVRVFDVLTQDMSSEEALEVKNKAIGVYNGLSNALFQSAHASQRPAQGTLSLRVEQVLGLL